MTDTPAAKALLAAPPKPPEPKADLIARVAKSTGVSPLRQFAELMRLGYGANKIEFNDYYTYRLFDPKLTKAEKRAFVGNKGNKALNDTMTPPERTASLTLLERKVPAEAHFRSHGLATTETQATVGYAQPVGDVPNLAGASEIAGFLRETARYPLFAKPESGSRSVGSALIASIDKGADAITLGNGRSVALDAFAAEVEADYGKGFILQSAIPQDPEVTALTGQALGTVRLLTVHDGTAARLLYALWKLPSPKAMSDNFWQEGSLLAGLDADTGEVLSCRKGTGLDQQEVTTHPVSGQPLTGFRVPNWQAVRDLGLGAHETLADLGVLGFDIGLSATGPVIVECNSNPFHTLYQIAFSRGILNPDLKPVLDRVIARQKAYAQAA